MSTLRLPDLRDIRRVLIIRLSSIGDVIHALPVSAALGDAYPHLEITWVVEEMSAPMVEGNPYLKEVIVLPRSRWKQGRTHSPQVWREYMAFLAGLRRRRFDLTLDLQGYAKSGLMALATGAPYRFGWWKMRDGAGIASCPLLHRPESVHRVDWFLDVVRAFGVEPTKVHFPLSISEVSRQKVSDLLCVGGVNPEQPFAVLNPAVGDQARRWGAECYAQLSIGLMQNFGMASVLIGSGKDREICEEVQRRAQELGGVAPLSLAGQTNLKELAAVLERGAVHVCGDTGSAHIAAALERPLVALYGPTDPAHAGPWGQRENVLAHRELCAGVGGETGVGCAVCHGDKKGKKVVSTSKLSAGREFPTPDTQHPTPVPVPCLAAITPEEVLAKVGEILKGQ